MRLQTAGKEQHQYLRISNVEDTFYRNMRKRHCAFYRLESAEAATQLECPILSICSTQQRIQVISSVVDVLTPGLT